MTIMIGLDIFFRNVKKMLAKIPCPEWYSLIEQIKIYVQVDIFINYFD
jgi:hypothetical protein